MRIRGACVFLTVAILLYGCASTPPVQRIAFNDAEFQRLPQNGTGIVEGQAFLKTLGGDVKFGAGETVRLIPVTSYGEQWWQVSVIEKREMAEPDPRYWSYIRTTQADGSGSFKFTDVPPGRYFINSQITWLIPSGPYGGMERQGGVVAHRIEVRDDKVTRVMITQ